MDFRTIRIPGRQKCWQLYLYPVHLSILRLSAHLELDNLHLALWPSVSQSKSIISYGGSGIFKCKLYFKVKQGHLLKWVDPVIYMIIVALSYYIISWDKIHIKTWF